MSGIYFFIEVIHAVRGRIEGLAAWRKRPGAVMAGQIAYFAMLTIAAATLLALCQTASATHVDERPAYFVEWIEGNDSQRSSLQKSLFAYCCRTFQME